MYFGIMVEQTLPGFVELVRRRLLREGAEEFVEDLDLYRGVAHDGQGLAGGTETGVFPLVDARTKVGADKAQNGPNFLESLPRIVDRLILVALDQAGQSFQRLVDLVPHNPLDAARYGLALLELKRQASLRDSCKRGRVRVAPRSNNHLTMQKVLFSVPSALLCRMQKKCRPRIATGKDFWTVPRRTAAFLLHPLL